MLKCGGRKRSSEEAHSFVVKSLSLWEVQGSLFLGRSGSSCQKVAVTYKRYHEIPLKMSSQSTNLSADYVSPSDKKTFSHALPSAAANNVTDKTAYLSALRSKSTELQCEINAYLTQKMEDDAKAAEGGANKRSKAEEREEEMYGEEDPEADD